MKNSAFLLLMLATSLPGFCQTESPVKWSFESRRKSSNAYEIILHATLPEPWHLYSQFTPDGGPLATRITFASNPIVTIEGAPKEVGKLVTRQDKNFGVEVRYFSGGVDFVQTIKSKSAVRTSVRGSIAYMICDDTKCLAPMKQPFTVEIQ